MEPLPTTYLRTARGYRFLRTYLRAVLGKGFLNTLRRVYPGDAEPPDDAEDEGLDTALGRMAARFYGLYYLSAQSVGLDPLAALLPDELDAFDLDLDAAVASAQAWLGSWETEADADVRVIVPVGHTYKLLPNGKKEPWTLYWAVLGVRALGLKTSFVQGFGPRMKLDESTGWECELGGTTDHRYTLLVNDTVEVRLRADVPPPTRAEFRALCDQLQTHDAIVEGLQALNDPAE